MKRKPSLRKLWYANVYDASDDGYVRDVQLNMETLLRLKYHSLSFSKNKQRKVLLDPQAPDYEDIFVEKGNALGPDDILEAVKPLALRIPIPLREDIPNLPLSDLLKALHYYGSHSGLQEHSCDETALLNLGMLVEQWADELVTDEYANLFAEEKEDLTGKLLPDDDEFVHQAHEYYSDSDESDVISLDMGFSDVETDIGRFLEPDPPAKTKESAKKAKETGESDLGPESIDIRDPLSSETQPDPDSDSDSVSKADSDSDSNSDSLESTNSNEANDQQNSDGSVVPADTESENSDESDNSSSDSLDNVTSLDKEVSNKRSLFSSSDSDSVEDF